MLTLLRIKLSVVQTLGVVSFALDARSSPSIPLARAFVNEFDVAAKSPVNNVQVCVCVCLVRLGSCILVCFCLLYLVTHKTGNRSV